MSESTLKKRLLLGLLFVLIPFAVHAIVTAIFVDGQRPTPSGFLVKVLLDSGSDAEGVHFSVDGAYRIFAGSHRREYDDAGFLAYGYRLGQANATALADGKISINNRTDLEGDAICFVPEKVGALRVGRNNYPGVLVIERNSRGGLRLVNLLDIEEYLTGVLFSEMPSKFPLEALKAQAVAARSYAVYMMAQGDGFLRPDERSQVYGGSAAINEKSREIVKQTAGEILTFSEKLIPAYYSSTCGGMTVKADDVFAFPSAAPLNHNSPCGFCSDSPFYHWSASFSIEEVVEKFDLSRVCRYPEVGVTATDSMRRAKEISLLDRQGNVLRSLSASSFRRTLNRGLPLRRRMLSTRIDSIETASGRVAIEGRGFGHGVGLCQYGARGLARRGDDYRRILSFYYKGCEISNLGDLQLPGTGTP